MKSHTGILFTSVLMLGGLVSIGNAFALTFESTRDVSFTLNPTIRVTLSNNNMKINDLAPGNSNDSNIIKVTAESNAIAGYTLSSTVGNSTTYNTTNMTHTNGTSTFTNLNSNKASLSNFDDSTWGYSYATCATVECTNTPSWISGDITGTTSSGYNGLPLYDTENPTKLINATAPGSSAVKFKFGAKASSSQIAGTYSNVINFIGVGKIITTTYTINFNDPSSEATSGTLPSTQTGTSTTGAVEISSTQPQRDNYIFKGWCTEQTTDDTCSGETVQPGGMLALHPGTSNLTPTVTRTLYAMWGDNIMTFDMAFALAGKTKQDNYYRIQDANSSICSVVTTGQIGQVMDSRDNEVYYIGKLKDNNCWMLDNLRLDITDSTALNSLTTTNTHVDADSLTSLKSGNRSAGNQYANGAIVQWDSNNPTNYNRAQANADSKDNTTTSFGNGSGKIGVYYNYCAASAGSYCYDEGSGVDIADTIQDAPYDLCPANWRMPTGGSLSGEYQSLYKAYSSDVTSFRNALSTPFSGYFYNGSVYDPSVGTDGDFWSSTYSNSSRMFYMFVDSNNVIPTLADYRFRGKSLRCLLDV